MRNKTITSEFDHDWNDLSVFEKLPVHKTRKKAQKRDDWKRDRQAQRKAKQQTQEKWYA
jgi:hypothetical protein